MDGNIFDHNLTFQTTRIRSHCKLAKQIWSFVTSGHELQPHFTPMLTHLTQIWTYLTSFDVFDAMNIVKFCVKSNFQWFSTSKWNWHKSCPANLMHIFDIRMKIRSGSRCGKWIVEKIILTCVVPAVFWSRVYSHGNHRFLYWIYHEKHTPFSPIWRRSDWCWAWKNFEDKFSFYGQRM